MKTFEITFKVIIDKDADIDQWMDDYGYGQHVYFQQYLEREIPDDTELVEAKEIKE